ncbi:hypothetical protein D3C71_1173590 [compost metagenome]
MRCAAMRFSGDRSGVRRTSVLPVCAKPPAATRRALSLRVVARLRAASVAGASNWPRAAGARTSAIRAKGKRDKLPMSMPANVTDKASGFKRRPSHTGHAAPVMNRATRFFIIALWVVANVCIT